MIHVEINFSPFATNVLDWVDKPGLTRPDGTPVKVTRDRSVFVITIGEKRLTASSNVEASYILNSCQAGINRD